MSVLANFINGSFIIPTTQSTVDVINPATGKCIAKVPLSTINDLDIAVEAGKIAFDSWSSLTLKARAAIIFKLHSLIDKYSQELAEIIVKENGKNITEALADIAKGNETVEWATGLPQIAVQRQLEVSRGVTCQELRMPLGVVGAIVPFNFPAMVPLWTIPIALTMGNCVILKPSEKVPLTMMRIAELMIEAGIPPGVFQIVHGAVDVVNGLCDHPDVRAVTFVGSSKVAELVSHRCHTVNKRVLALGGAKNHLLALPDCDVSMVSRDIVASFAGCAGQRCMAASVLILVGDGTAEAKQYLIDTLLHQVIEATKPLVAGQLAGQVGPLIDEIAKKRVLSYINEAEASGASILLDGRSWADKEAGFWIGPTIIMHEKSTDAAMQDEIFGPVLSVYYADSRDEAILIENSNPYGNAACVYTEKGSHAEWFIKRFRAGMLGINIGIPVPREPFSFGGLYGTKSKYGDCDITADGAMEFFTNRIKITTKWSIPTAGTTTATSTTTTGSSDSVKRQKVMYEDKASFDGKM